MFKFFDTIKKEDKELNKSSDKIKNGLSAIFSGKKLNKEIIEDLESLLISSDISINIVNNIIDFLLKNKFEKEINIKDVKEIIFKKFFYILNEVHNNYIVFDTKPYVMMFLGVNGSGKTTIIGKLANELKKENKKVLLAACDTFRAGAAEQLNILGDRAGVDIIQAEKQNEDPASVAYKAFQKAKKEDYDILLIDTAGRLQNNINLMTELSKVEKVLKKIDKNIPNKNILVLDATIGQNSIKQFDLFQKYVNIDGVIMNKMDSTSKGGILISIIDKFKKPIYAIGTGEKIDNIKNFDTEEFLKNLLNL